MIEADALDWCRVTVHDGAVGTRVIVPDSNGCVAGSGGDQAALLVEIDIADGTLMSDELVWAGIRR